MATTPKARTTARAARVPSATQVTPKGRVTAVVAVTGVKDDVDDIIVPGVFGPALAKRHPKVVFHHKPDDFVGRVVDIYELAPGDPRLPKAQPNGQPWPAEAGALIAVMQFNMNTARGREVYEWARFYAETGEAAWSIGYTVPRGLSEKRGGIRFILGIDLYEVSLVLHGAHPMTMALEVKSAQQAVDAARAMEYKAAALTPDADAPVHTGIMVALYPPADVAAQLAVPGGEPTEELHVTLAYLGDSTDVTFTAEQVADAIRPATEQFGPLDGTLGGLGLFPAEDDGAPVWVPVDVPGLEQLRESIVDYLETGPTAGAVARNHGYTPHMTLGYDLDDVSPAPRTPVTFRDVHVVFAGQHLVLPLGATEDATAGVPMEAKAAVAMARMETKYNTASLADTPAKDNWVDQVGGLPLYIRAIANALIRDQGLTDSRAIATAVAAVKRWARGGDDVKPDTVAKAAAAVAEWEAKKVAAHADNRIEKKSALTAVMQAKSYDPLAPIPESPMSRSKMTGSYEELSKNLHEALNKKLCGHKPGAPDNGWVDIEATFPDHVIVTVFKGDREAESFQVPYTSGLDGKVTLGTPQKVTIDVVAIPDGLDGVAPPTALDRAIAPAIAHLGDVTAAVSALPLEQKSIRQLRPALVELLDSLSEKGMDVPGVVFGEDEDEDLDSDLDGVGLTSEPGQIVDERLERKTIDDLPAVDEDLPPVETDEDLEGITDLEVGLEEGLSPADLVARDLSTDLDVDDAETKGGIGGQSAGTAAVPSLGEPEKVDEIAPAAPAGDDDEDAPMTPEDVEAELAALRA